MGVEGGTERIQLLGRAGIQANGLACRKGMPAMAWTVRTGRQKGRKMAWTGDPGTFLLSSPIPSSCSWRLTVYQDESLGWESPWAGGEGPRPRLP